jgi:ketosteroid isomerase-like protein
MRIRSVAIVPIVLATSLLGVGACGQSQSSNTDKFSGAEKDVAQAVYDLRDAVTKRDEAKICDTYFTPALRDEVAQKGKAAGRGSTCAKAIEDSIADIDATDLKVEDVTVQGSAATVRIKTNLSGSKQDPVDTLTLENARGWRISKLP